MRCKQCGKEITSRPCPHCGSQNLIYEEQVGGVIDFTGSVESVLIKASSETTIEKEGEFHTFRFDPGVNSGEIVDASLMQAELGNLATPPIRDQIIYNINQFEIYAEESTTPETTREHSFELNFGFFKYKYKRTKKS